jgi:hypothetical protein
MGAGAGADGRAQQIPVLHTASQEAPLAWLALGSSVLQRIRRPDSSSDDCS